MKSRLLILALKVLESHPNLPLPFCYLFLLPVMLAANRNKEYRALSRKQANV
jgi:integral membrane sensor domain MASE1